MADIKESSNRSKNVKKNVYFSVLLKVVGVGLSFLTLPLTLHYLTAVEYGVWITLFSIMNWINMLDIGIGLGMRNKLAEAVAKKNKEAAKIYISTGFFSILCIAIVLFIVMVISISSVDIQSVFNTKDISSKELYMSVLLTGIFVTISFVLGLINQIYYAFQKAAFTGLISVVNGVLLLVIIYALTMRGSHSLVYFVCGFGIAMIFSKVVFIVIFFEKHMDFIPAWRFLKISKLKEITNMGIKFFVIQICCIVGFGFSNILITQLLGPEYVRTYDVVFKIFNVSVMIQNLVLAPLWSAYTDAFAKGDYQWIKRVFWKTCRMSTVIVTGMVIVAFFVDELLYLWLSMHFTYSIWLIIGMVLYHTLSLFGGNCCMILNGIGRLDVQMYAWVIAALLIVPTAYIFTHNIGMNIEGIIWALNGSMVILLTALSLDINRLFMKWK